MSIDNFTQKCLRLVEFGIIQNIKQRRFSELKTTKLDFLQISKLAEIIVKTSNRPLYTELLYNFSIFSEIVKQQRLNKIGLILYF